MAVTVAAADTVEKKDTTVNKDSFKERITEIAKAAGFNIDNSEKGDLSAIIGAFIAAVLGVLGLVFVILVVYGGVQWMTAEGNTDQVDKAQKTIRDGVIGIGIVIFSAAISYFFFSLFTV